MSEVNVSNKTVQTVTGVCVRCAESVSIFVIGPALKNYPPGCESAWMLPMPKTAREFKFQPEDGLLEDLYDAYTEAVRCYQNKLWRATVTECGRALDIIKQDRLGPNAGKKLNKIDELSKTGRLMNEAVPEVLFAPIIAQIDIIRLTRHTGAHFKDKKPGVDEATEVLDMTEYAIEYFYLMPRRAEELRSKLKDDSPSYSEGSDTEEKR